MDKHKYCKLSLKLNIHLLSEASKKKKKHTHYNTRSTLKNQQQNI